jgi:hypothetical protein
VKVSPSDIAAMHQELIDKGKIAAGEAWALVAHPLDVDAVTKMERPSMAEIWPSRQVRMGYVYVLTLQQAAENCPREGEAKTKGGEG